MHEQQTMRFNAKFLPNRHRVASGPVIVPMIASSLTPHTCTLLHQPVYNTSNVQAFIESLHCGVLQGCSLTKDILLNRLHYACNSLEVVPRECQ